MKTTERGRDGQGWLPFIPEDLEALGLKDVDVYPRCSAGRGTGFKDMRRRPGPVAWKDYPHVQHHGTNVYTGIYLDVDRPFSDVIGAADADEIPAPSVAVTRIRNAHSQCGWVLATPVHRYPAAAGKPLKLFARTAEYFADVLGADPGYTSVLFRNGPLHAARPGWHVDYNGPPGGWPLYELADWIPKGWRRPRNPLTAEGRNCSLFLTLCRFAGSGIGRTADLALEAARINRTFGVPLDAREVWHVVQHVEGYRSRWEAAGWHRPSWIARQARRGRKGARKGGLKGGPLSGAARRASRAPDMLRAAAMRADGASVGAIATVLGRSPRTIYRWLQRQG